MENTDKYLLQKYNEREYGIFDTEKDEFIQKGSLKDMQDKLQELRGNNDKSIEGGFKDYYDNHQESKEVKTESVNNTDSLVDKIINWYDSDMGNHFDEIQGNEEEFRNEVESAIENKDVNAIKSMIDYMSDDSTMTAVVNELNNIIKDSKTESFDSDLEKAKEDSIEKGLYSESKEGEIPVINPNDSKYYDNLYLVGIDMQVGAVVKEFKVYANYEEQALEIVSAYLEENLPAALLDEEDIEPECINDYIYIDATEYGASQPHYLPITCTVEPVEMYPVEENKLVEEDEEKTTYDYLQDRIGQNLSVPELNNILQSLFAKYDRIFIQYNDIIDADDWSEPQELYVTDDDDTYTIIYDIIDAEEGIISITDVILE